jgi:hypothetical protein
MEAIIPSMNELKAVLDELRKTLEWQGEPVELLFEGLPPSEVEKEILRLPYRLPDEVHELYQWCNGTSDDFRDRVNFRPYYRLLPLQEAVDNTLRLLESQRHFRENPAKYRGITTVWTHNIERLFPILALEDRCFYSVQGSLEAKNPAKSQLFDDLLDQVPIPIATSLKGFFQSLLECWDIGVYSLNPSPRIDIGCYDTFLIDENKEREIFARNRE